MAKELDRQYLKQLIDKINVDELKVDELDNVSSILDYTIWLMMGKLKECLDKQIKHLERKRKSLEPDKVKSYKVW